MIAAVHCYGILKTIPKAVKHNSFLDKKECGGTTVTVCDGVPFCPRATSKKKCRRASTALTFSAALSEIPSIPLTITILMFSADLS